ncbi:MAG: hypothetical protein E4H14_13500 [Candidatus Thorarchaeota archaeon]|nr:MAG: hypothetical protein E4H14_13500 [Candidatus Thorarchaeota archaeon]
MTGQISDQFKYEGDVYNLVGLDGESLYTADDFGITTQMASTACWRGYQMFYDCVDGDLILDSLHVRTKDKITINGIAPKEGQDDNFMFNCIYENLALKTKFTGTLLLGKDFIQEMYVHMGFQSAESYRTVYEIEVRNGDIIKVTDLSTRMEERRIRGQEKPASPPSDDEKDVSDWIKDRFSQEYNPE